MRIEEHQIQEKSDGGLVAITTALMVGLVFALEPVPVRPAVPEPVENECARAIPVRFGEKASGFVTSGKFTCSGEVMPVSQVADLLATQKWGVGVERAYRVRESYHLLKIEQLEKDLLKTQERLEVAEAPPPWWARPWVQRAIGGATVMGTVWLAAYGLNAVNDSEEMR